MPRSRGSEVPQRPSPRGPPHLRTSSSDSDPSHHRAIPERSPKIGERRSPRGAQSDPVSQKKLGTRIADLESQLGQAQDELKNLKDQLASAEAAKKEAQEKLEKKTKKPPLKESPPEEESRDSSERDNKPSSEAMDDNGPKLEETDVFEVPVEKMTIEPNSKVNEKSPEPPSALEREKDEEIERLRAKLRKKEREAEAYGEEKAALKAQLSEAASSARAKEDEMSHKLKSLGEELETSRANAARLGEQLRFVEEAKEALEAEMKKTRVQTEQWKKAADAAAAVLAGGMDMNGRIPERCGSMDKHFDGIFDPRAGAGYARFIGSPADEMDDGFGAGKRKGSGIRMFGDLWRKKGQK